MFINRENEIKELNGIYKNAGHSGLKVSIITGHPGVGKSKLTLHSSQNHQSVNSDIFIDLYIIWQESI